jgi:hypothetical protein
MTIEEPAFFFELIFPEGDDIIFSSLSNQEVIINNTGDVPAPVRIQFLGGSTNPTITNETTGEFITVNKVIASNEILEITTGYGDKRVELIADDGTRTNAFNYIDLDSTFFSLALGENILSYNADSGACSTRSIYYSNKYLGREHEDF